jgi:DNA repair exonuclease SbcCD ATPase subunit
MTDLIRSQEIQHCPECDVGLVIRNGKLNLAEHTECASGVDVSDVKSEIDALRVTLRGYGDKLREINALLVEAKILKDTAVKDPNPDIKSKDEIEKKRSEIKKLRSDMEANNRSTELARKEIKSIEQELSLRSNNLLTMKKKIEEGADVLTVEQIDAQKNDINAKIVNLQQLTSDNAADILEYQGYVADKRVYDAIAAQTNEMVEDLTSIKQKIKTTEEKLQDAANMWAGAVRLKEISDNAAISATEGIIGAINQYAEEHINQLFPHGGTAVKIMSGTKTNKGEDRAKLALNVTHKSQPVGKSISPLSGGEKDRVKVAFQLALAEIYRASFLMLDEPFAGIDFEMTMEICLKLLKSFSSDRLVFMAQHGAPEGLFDAVIEI